MNKGLPFEYNSFDAATSVWANRYVTDSDAFLREVARVLRPGGVFIWPIHRTERSLWKRKNGVRQHTTAKSLGKDALVAGFKTMTIVKSSSLENDGRVRIPYHSRPRYLILTK